MTTWHDHEKAHEYVGRIGTVPSASRVQAALAEFLPPAPRRALDLGCGDGRLVRLVLEHRPDIEEVVGGRQLAAHAGGRPGERGRRRSVTVVDADLREPLGDWGRFDLVTTGFAVHHLPDARKRTLLTEVVAVLEPGRDVRQPRSGRVGDPRAARGVHDRHRQAGRRPRGPALADGRAARLDARRRARAGRLHVEVAWLRADGRETVGLSSREERRMIRLSVFYPASEGTRFDHDY